MSVQAIELHLGGTAQTFVPTGVTDEWELTIVTPRGPEPGGHWQSEEVARAVVDAIFGEAA